MKTIIIHTENILDFKNQLSLLSKDYNKSEHKLFINCKNYIPWSDEYILNEITSYQEYYAYPTNKSIIDSVIELVLKSKTDDIIIIDENPNTNKYIGKRSDFLKSNLDTKYKSLDWFLVDVNTQIDNRGIPMYFFIPHQPNEDSQRYFKKIDIPLFNEQIIYLDGGLGDHIMALPLLEKIQQQVYVCCKYPFIFNHLNLKGYVNWNDDLFGGYNRFVYEYGSSNNIETIIDAFFGLYGENREQTDKLVYNGSREEDIDINVSNKKIALICTSAAKIENLDSNKDWKDVRWMNLVHQLKKLGYFVIQVGTSKDNQIPNVNLKYLDKPIPKLAWLTDNSSLWISVDTFFHHFASAIKPDVGICLTPFYNDHAKHFGVTYIEKDCGKNYWDRRWWMDLQQPERKECMELIQIEDVLEKLQNKKKVITIFSAGHNEDNCSNWRMFQQYDGLSNFEIKHSSGFGHNIEETLKSDVVIIMRPVLNCIEHIRFLRKNGVKVVLDYDDAFPYVNHNDQFFLRSSMEFLELVKECDLITTSTDRLKYYFSLLTDVQCVVLPNIINPIYVNQYKVKNEDKIVLGWFGSSGHISSLRPIKDVIIKVLNEFENVYFNLYTDNPEIVNLFYHPKTNFIPYNFKFDQFQNSLGDVDINIAPINETYINLHKSNIRIILPGYKGIPSVASNFGEYKDMGKENVLLCDTPQDWYENLKEIILNEEKRKTLSKNIKELVESKFIFQKWGNYKKEIFEKLL
jgi:ADP-heptose:LPS heptosyltransferase